jgi:hypothetical protein
VEPPDLLLKLLGGLQRFIAHFGILVLIAADSGL